MVRKLQIVAGIVIVVLFIVIPALLSRKNRQEAPRGIVAQTITTQESGFARADGPQELSFPADHGSHPDYQTEWWYYTGNLQTEDGRRFGFQLTFFRRALQPADQTNDRASDWAASQVYMAHFAMSDIGGGRYWAFERLSRGAAGLAGAQAEPFRVWLEDWQVEQTIMDTQICPDPNKQPCAYRLFAAQEGVSVELDMLDTKGPILQGDEGFSQKGADSGQASYYYSLTRLQAEGRVTIGGETFDVTGLSWMDHEWSTSALSKEQVGWDWFSLQFEDGSEMMVFQIRSEDGSIDPFSSGTLIAADGSTILLGAEDFIIEVTETWSSPHSGAIYPAGWTVRIPKMSLELQIEPHMNDQELNVSYAYWEGAVQVTGTRDGGPMVGNGYVELTGYSGSMGGEF